MGNTKYTPRVSDHFLVQVPNTGETYELPAGLYQLKIVGVLSATKPSTQRYAVSVQVSFTAHFSTTLTTYDELKGKAYLGTNEFPVDCQFQPNIELRLQASLVAIRGKGLLNGL